MEEVKRPTEWKVVDHLFTGFLLVDVPSDGTMGFGREKGVTDAWLPYRCDLRRVAEMKQRTLTDESTVLYSEQGAVIAVVNATVAELTPSYMEARAARYKSTKPTFS